MVCITLIDTKETQNRVLKNERTFKESSKARMIFNPTATFRGLFVRTCNYDTWLVYTFKTNNAF